ncbi:hypothetical protein ILUMI_08774, partial [Ignelater luminosus]
HARLTALTEIERIVKSARPSTTQAEIKTKFHALKTNFLNENKKVHQSKHSGAGDQTYHPTLWYFERMKFVLEHANPRRNIDSIVGHDDAEEAENAPQIYDDENNMVYNFERDILEDDPLVSQCISEQQSLTERPVNNSAAESSSAVSTSSAGSIPPRNKKRRTEAQILLDVAGALTGINKNLQPPAATEKSSEDIFGKF